MNAPQNIKFCFLIGMPGAGKTYWGERIAAHYQIEFIDLDRQIETIAGKSVADIFNADGEEKFRQLEHEALQTIIAGHRTVTVVSCGGGTPFYFNNLELMKQSGVVIYLKSEIRQLIKNLDENTVIRPLLAQTNDLAATLTTLLRQRQAVYEQAHHILPTGNISLTTFAQIIAICTNRQ